MNTCFVMQPFDQGVFDQRYEDVIKPAIRNAVLEAYRVDQDPKVSIPIKEIENGIREATICLAEITVDNPNVWFELGYAIACRKQVVLICSEERSSKFPFDVQHRTIIKYQTGSRQVLDKLQNEITTKVKAYLEKAEKLTVLSEFTKPAKFEGLKQHEIVCLAAIAENIDHPSDHIVPDTIKNDMENSGYTKMASTIALRSLLTNGLIHEEQYPDEYNQYNDFYTGYSLSKSGWDWIMSNEKQFVLRHPTYNQTKPIPDDDIPF